MTPRHHTSGNARPWDHTPSRRRPPLNSRIEPMAEPRGWLARVFGRRM